MSIRILIILLAVGITSFSQVSNEEIANKAIKQLAEGNTFSAYSNFKKLIGMDNNNPTYKGYLSYTYTKLCLQGDTIYANEVEEAKKFAKDALTSDSNSYINQLAYVNTLFLSSKNTKLSKEKASLLIEIKQKLDVLIKNKDVNADAYNLLAIWNRTVASFDDFEIEMMKTFFKTVPTGATYEQAIVMHKKAFELNERPEYKYELALTYKSIGLEDLYINTLNEGRDMHGESMDDKAYQAKCEKLLPQLGN